MQTIPPVGPGVSAMERRCRRLQSSPEAGRFAPGTAAPGACRRRGKVEGRPETERWRAALFIWPQALQPGGAGELRPRGALERATTPATRWSRSALATLRRRRARVGPRGSHRRTPGAGRWTGARRPGHSTGPGAAAEPRRTVAGSASPVADAAGGRRHCRHCLLSRYWPAGRLDYSALTSPPPVRPGRRAWAWRRRCSVLDPGGAAARSVRQPGQDPPRRAALALISSAAAGTITVSETSRRSSPAPSSRVVFAAARPRPLCHQA